MGKTRRSWDCLFKKRRGDQNIKENTWIKRTRGWRTKEKYDGFLVSFCLPSSYFLFPFCMNINPCLSSFFFIKFYAWNSKLSPSFPSVPLSFLPFPLVYKWFFFTNFIDVVFSPFLLSFYPIFLYKLYWSGLSSSLPVILSIFFLSAFPSSETFQLVLSYMWFLHPFSTCSKISSGKKKVPHTRSQWKNIPCPSFHIYQFPPPCHPSHPWSFPYEYSLISVSQHPFVPLSLCPVFPFVLLHVIYKVSSAFLPLSRSLVLLSCSHLPLWIGILSNLYPCVLPFRSSSRPWCPWEPGAPESAGYLAKTWLMILLTFANEALRYVCYLILKDGPRRDG